MLQSPTLPPRPTMSLAGKLRRHDDPFLAAEGQEDPPCKDSIKEKEADANTEVETALSRLRSTVKRKKQQQKTSVSKAYTLAELNDMIDDAIEEHAADVPAEASGKSSTHISLKPTVVRHSQSERASRRSLEDVAFSALNNKGQRPTSPSRGRKMSSLLARNPDQDWLPKQTSQDRARQDPGLRSGSPVKQRAALFETMHQQPEGRVNACEAPHDPHIHVKSECSVVPSHENTFDKEKELHYWKFGKTIYDRSEVPKAISPQDGKGCRNSTQSSHETLNSFNTANFSPQRPDVPDENGAVAGGIGETPDLFDTAKASSPSTDISDENRVVAVELPHEHADKTPVSWLNTWKFFSKGSSVPPRTDEDVVEATPPRNEHYQSSRTSIVRAKVEKLLRRDEEEQDRRQSVLEHRSRAQSRRPSMVKEGELRGALPKSPYLKPAQLPPLQIPAQEQAELVGAFLDTTSSSSSETRGKGAAVKPHSVEPEGLMNKGPIHQTWAVEEVLRDPRPRLRARSLRYSSRVESPLQGAAQERDKPNVKPLDTASTRSTEVEGGASVEEPYSVEPTTPTRRSWAEKEVLDFSKAQSRADSVHIGSLVKAELSTPGPGRSVTMRQSRSPRGSPYIKEQAFILSPAPSRSQSRAGSRARVHRVEVEMRDSPEREARERGETILIIRATNVIEEAED